MPDMHTRVSGAWKKVDALHVKVSGAWKAVQVGYVKVSGTWKEFYAAIAYALSGQAGIIGFVIDPGTAKAGVRINADGTIDKRVNDVYSQIDAATDWVIPNGGATGSERFKCTDNNANLDGSSSATGSWIAAPCTWWIEHTGLPPKQLDIDIEISILGYTPTDDTGNYTGNASTEP